MKRTTITVLSTVLSLGVAQRSAYAGPIFTFDGVGISTSSELTAGSNSVQSYMNGVLSLNGGGTVLLSGGGLSSTSNIVSNNYNGEDHVFCGQHGGVSCSGNPEWTLGTTDGTNSPHGGNNDNFLYTFTGTSIIMAFSGVAPVASVSFDFEIFPDASCSNATTCGQNVPDFMFQVNGSPVANGHVFATNPPANSHSPSGNESNPQLGPTFFSYSFAAPQTSFTLEFDDWPATIGIDNLTFAPPVAGRSVTPEPGTMLLLGSGLVGFIARKRLKAAK